ncbi:MAG: 2Fe-2S iron-sulfur cluster binding domain-containing protein [Streptomyces sp.]|nr:2Fe-2S iron-sulfur cluster binding domain-containing protein [Streptomyces sp.]
MDPKLWWYLARAGGLTAWWLVSLTVLWGLLLSTRVLGGRTAPSWLLDLHRLLGGLAVVFTGLHIAGLVWDEWVHFGWADILVPMAASYRPGAVAWGVVALYLLAAIQITSLLKSRIPEALWRWVHRTAFVVFVSGTVHTFTAGTDADGPLVRWSAAVIAAAFMFLVTYRIAAGRRITRRTTQIPAPRAGRGFHPLTVREVRRETEDAVSVAFHVPPGLVGDFRFTPGQHLTLKVTLDGAEHRRTYSICSGTGDGELRIAVKRVSGGRVSTWVTSELRAGDTVEVSTPVGRFTTETNPLGSRHLLGVAAGSGITPVAAITKSVLLLEPHSRCTLVYGNKDPESVMLRAELEALVDTYGERLRLIHVFSRHDTGVPALYGRLDQDRFRALTQTHAPDVADADEAFLCGPAEMTQAVSDTLAGLGMTQDRIHTERFTGGAPAPTAPVDSAAHDVTIVDRGTKTTITVRPGESVLDAGLRAGLDLPYSCQEGICGTCRAKSTGGPVRLDDCDLDSADIAAGYVLTCRTRPRDGRAVIDFDQA